MVKLLFFRFRVTQSKLKNKKIHFDLLTRWVHFYFLTFELRTWSWKWKKFLKYYIFKMTWTASFYYVFLYLACFVASTYVIFIWVIWILIAYVQQKMAGSTFLFTRLLKTFSSCEPKEEWPHPDLYKYNGRQIGLFHVKWINRAKVDVFVRLVLV